MKKDFTLELVG